MTQSTPALAPAQRSRAFRETLDLLASMRFAIALLSVICIASVIGTLVQQAQPAVNYVNQFGPFWAQVFGALGLYTVYSVAWFLLILAFLVLSTSLCIARNAPKILVDVRTYKENIREGALNAFHHKARGEIALGRDAALAHVNAWLAKQGWKGKVQIREGGVMVAAKQGTANKIGYLAAHSAIVLVCVGGLLDGDMVVRFQMLLADKTPYAGGGLLKDVPPAHRLGVGNPTFRANLFVPEGAKASTAVISLSDGVVLQDLPFDLELKKFIVEYYETGMPKLFASDIVIHDPDGTQTTARVKVNEPMFHRGVAIYQSSFEDGGSRVTLTGRSLEGAAPPIEITGEIGTSSKLTRTGNKEALQLELAGLRVINVENMSAGGSGAADNPGSTDVRKVDLTASLDKHLGSGAKPVGDKQLHNIGPSVSYRLRDAAGQAREYNNYMLPVELDGLRVFLFGVRDSTGAEFRYLRVPADAQDSPDEWLRVKAALADPELRRQAATRYASKAAPADNPKLAEQLKVSSQRALNLFAGAESPAPAATPVDPDMRAGLAAVQMFVQTNVPEADRNRTAEVLVRILNGSLFELTNLVREQAGSKPLPPDETTQRLMGQTVLSLSESFVYPAPLVFTLKDFQQVQASVFQVSRAPGKKLVYTGCAFLIIGVFAMLYIRERRLWIWLQDGGTERTRLTMALSTTRQTLDTDREFETLKAAFLSPELLPELPQQPGAPQPS